MVNRGYMIYICFSHNIPDYNCCFNKMLKAYLLLCYFILTLYLIESFNSFANIADPDVPTRKELPALRGFFGPHYEAKI